MTYWCMPLRCTQWRGWLILSICYQTCASLCEVFWCILGGVQFRMRTSCLLWCDGHAHPRHTCCNNMYFTLTVHRPWITSHGFSHTQQINVIICTTVLLYENILYSYLTWHWLYVLNKVIVFVSFRDVKPDNILLDEQGKDDIWFHKPSWLGCLIPVIS